VSIEGGTFSPDAAFYALVTRSADFPPFRAPLVIQALGDTVLGAQWEVPGVHVAWGDFATEHIAWQP
jgi:hypothetical protein